MSDDELIEDFYTKQGGKAHPSADIWFFGSDWNMLMDVVDKISKLHDSKFHYDVDKIKDGDWPKDDEYMEVIALPMATPISDTYSAVVKFIKYYNQTKP